MPPKRKHATTSKTKDLEATSEKKRRGRGKKEVDTDVTNGDEPQKKQSRSKKEADTDVTNDDAPQKKQSLVEKEDDTDETNGDEPQKKRSRTKKAAAEPKAAPANKTLTDWKSIDFTCTKKNAENKPYNLKISCWNVGGLKSWVKKGCMEYITHEMPDIFCMQETKCNEENIPAELDELNNYQKYWCASKKDGYAGVGLMTIPEPMDVRYGIGDKVLDEEGRCITAEYKDYYVVCTYVPNAGRGLVTLPKRLDWNKAFKKFILSLEEKKPVIIAGDMNVSHQEIDLARPKNNTKNAGFTPEEREGMTDFLGAGYIDTFRYLYPEKKDAYTFWTYMMNARGKNIGWRLDYFLVSEKLKGKICDTVIRSEVLGSDHCPITLFLNI